MTNINDYEGIIIFPIDKYNSQKKIIEQMSFLDLRGNDLYCLLTLSVMWLYDEVSDPTSSTFNKQG